MHTYKYMSVINARKTPLLKHWSHVILAPIYRIRNMVPTGSDESKLRTFQGPSQDQISGYKDFYGEFRNAYIK